MGSQPGFFKKEKSRLFIKNFISLPKNQIDVDNRKSEISRVNGAPSMRFPCYSLILWLFFFHCLIQY